MATEDVKLELKLNDGRGKAIVMTSDPDDVRGRGTTPPAC
jgi:hypothetical protein